MKVDTTLLDLRIRSLKANKAIRQLGLGRNYIGIMDVQAAKEGKELTPAQKVRIRQLLHGNFIHSDLPLLELVERATATQYDIINSSF